MCDEALHCSAQGQPVTGQASPGYQAGPGQATPSNRFGFHSRLQALNISVTYICIHVYLKMKHTKAINIAEKTQWTMKVTLISLRHLACGFYCFLGCGVYNFCVVQQNAYQNLQSVPSGSILVNFVCVWISMHFILTKKEIIDFLKRRIVIHLPDILPSSKTSPYNIQLNIENKRKIAWN